MRLLNLEAKRTFLLALSPFRRYLSMATTTVLYVSSFGKAVPGI